MDLFDAHAKGLPLVVETEAGGARLAAEIFRSPYGVDYADIGWPDASWHPFHRIAGKIVETEDGWSVGEARIRTAFAGERLYADWTSWQSLRSEGWARFDRAACEAEMKASGILEDPPIRSV